jgi:hypothetical protein
MWLLKRFGRGELVQLVHVTAADHDDVEFEGVPELGDDLAQAGVPPLDTETLQPFGTPGSPHRSFPGREGAPFPSDPPEASPE